MNIRPTLVCFIVTWGAVLCTFVRLFPLPLSLFPSTVQMMHAADADAHRGVSVGLCLYYHPGDFIHKIKHQSEIPMHSCRHKGVCWLSSTCVASTWDYAIITYPLDRCSEEKKKNTSQWSKTPQNSCQLSAHISLTGSYSCQSFCQRFTQSVCTHKINLMSFVPQFKQRSFNLKWIL